MSRGPRSARSKRTRPCSVWNMTVETKPNLESETVDSSEDVPGSEERSVEAHANVLSVEHDCRNQTKPGIRDC
jgi:hypothetical protein